MPHDLFLPNLAALRRRMGDWAFVRYMRNKGLPFNVAYWVMFGRLPTYPVVYA